MSFSAIGEVYCRCEEDYNYCFNCMALAIAETDSELLAESIMSTHFHECLRTRDPKRVARIHRYAYSRYFNYKYGRRGRFGERSPFIIELDGLYHTLAAVSYTLRNPVHHGVTSTPFGYRHSSACSYFRKELGYDVKPDLMPRRHLYHHLPNHVACPDGYRMHSSGLLLREDSIAVAEVEHMFVTPRSYLYYMNRLSGEEWIREQEKDGENSSPVTLDIVERGDYHMPLSRMLANERGRSNYNVMTDDAVCQLVDNELVPDAGYDSVYLLPDNVKNKIGELLYLHYKVPVARIRRCLAMGV